MQYMMMPTTDNLPFSREPKVGMAHDVMMLIYMASQCPVCDVPSNRMFQGKYHVRSLLHNMPHVTTYCF